MKGVPGSLCREVTFDLAMVRRTVFVLVMSILTLGTSAIIDDFTVTTNPDSGSVITAFEYQNHIMIQCRISQGGNIVNTVWTASVPDDGGSGASGADDASLSPQYEIEIRPDDDVRFSIFGNGNSFLVIDVFAPELNGTVIYCRNEMGRYAADFTLRSTPIVVVTDPPPGPVIVEEFGNVTILCDIQHENVNQQHWVVQGELLPDEGNEHFIISGDHQSQLTVVNFTEALDRTVIFCQIAFHGNIDIAQFTLLLPGSVMSGSGDDYILTLRPPPGVIEGFEGQENIEICCEIYRDMRITPRWSLITAEDYKLGLDPVIINPDNDTRFIFELGDPEELEIEVLIPELDGAIISCHETATEEMEVVGSWTLSSFPLVITNNPPSGIIFRPLHSQIHITCHVDRIDSIYWILVPPQQEGYMQITSSDTRFVISGESMETLTVVDFSEDLNRAHIFCQIPYHGDIDIGGFQLALFPFKVPGIEWPPVNEQCNPEHSVEIRQNITEYIREKLQALAAQTLDGY